MKKISFLAALLCACMISFAQEPVYDVNFALASNGSSATSSTGNAALAIDGNEDTRWESAQTDDEWFLLDMGQARTFSRVNIKWEGAYAKQFTLTYSTDGESWNNLYTETNLTKAGWQTIDVTETTARYIKYQGIERATQWGQSFYEFQVMLPGVSVLTTIQLTAPSRIAKVNEGIALTAKALDQNGTEMEAQISYEVSPADAGAVVNGTYVPAKIGDAAIVAKSGDVVSDTISVFGYEGSNLALSTNIDNDNKAIAQSDYLPSGTNAFFAIDGIEGSVYQGCPTNGTAGDEASRTYDVWFVVDLGANYDIDLITIHFEGACSQDYHVDFATDTTNWALGYNYVGTAGINGRTDMLTATELDNNLKVRYVRFWSTKAGTEWGMKMFEFQVYGREWVPSGDTEAPVMVSATLESKTWSSAVIAVSATDNNEVTKYHVVDATNAIDVKLTPNDNKITVSGLSASTTYNFTITALDASLNESANSKTVEVTTDAHQDAPEAAPAAPTWPANQVKAVYSATYTADCGFGEWGSGTAYTQDEYGKKYVTTSAGYFGLTFDGEGEHLNCANMEKLHLDVWVADNASVNVYPIWGGTEQGLPVSLVGGKWNSVEIALADYTTITSWIDIYQIKIAEAKNLTLWLNNIYFYTTVAPEKDSIAPTDFTAEVAETSFFSARIKVHAKDNSGVVKYDAIYDELLVASTTGASDADAYITVPKLAPNSDYNFSIVAKDESGNMAAPIVVAAKTLPVPTSAPAPDFTNKETVAVFCDSLENNPVISIGQWGQSTIVEPGELVPGDNVYYCSNMNYLGWEFTPHIDATDMEYVHIDFFAPNMTSIQVTPISPGKEGIYTVQLAQNEWTSVDVPLSAYDNNGIDWSDIFQFKFMDATPNGKDVFIDNVYFFKSTAEGIEDVEAGVKAVKVIENGQLIIIKNGVRYTLMGAELR